jgi:hypothetical protein
MCFYPIWVDLKGKDSIPEFVHHAVCRVSVPRAAATATATATAAAAATAAATATATTASIDLRNVSTFTDKVHSAAAGGGGGGNRGAEERLSQAVKERKQKMLLEIVDKFEVCIYRHWLVNIVGLFGMSFVSFGLQYYN